MNHGGILALVVAMLGCQGEKPGDRCDRFFTNTCKSPMSCVDMDDKKVCAGSCDNDNDKTTGAPIHVCKEKDMEPSEVSYTQGSTSLGSAGCYCLPKKK